MNRQMLIKIADACDAFLKAVKEPDWKRLHRIADGAASDMRDAFLKAVAKLQGDIAVKKVEDALARGDAVTAEAVINWPFLEASLGALALPLLQDVAVRSGRVALASLPAPEMRLSYSFDLLNQNALDWAKGHVGDLVTQVTRDTQLGVRAIIEDAFVSGGHPYKTARDIQRLVGLTQQQTQAVLNHAAMMRTDGLDEDTIASESQAYSDRLHLYRAETIARNETINASKEGQNALWRDAVDQGYLKPDEWERFWITTDDDRTCPACMGMDGKIAPLDGDFDTSYGPMKTAHLHVQCRCSEGLRRKGGGQNGSAEA